MTPWKSKTPSVDPGVLSVKKRFEGASIWTATKSGAWTQLTDITLSVLQLSFVTSGKLFRNKIPTPRTLQRTPTLKTRLPRAIHLPQLRLTPQYPDACPIPIPSSLASCPQFGARPACPGRGLVRFPCAFPFPSAAFRTPLVERPPSEAESAGASG